MEDHPFKVSTIINDTISTSALIDSGCLTYGVIDSRFAAKHRLPRIQCGPYPLQSIERVAEGAIREAAYAKVDVGGRVTRTAYFYVVPKIEGYSIILGRRWMRLEQAVKDVTAGTLMFKDTGMVIHEEQQERYDHRPINGAGFSLLTQGKARKKVKVFVSRY